MKVRSEHRHVEEMTALPKRAFISSTLCCLTRVWSIILSIYPVLAATGGRSLVVPLASLRIIPAGTDGFFWTDRSVIVTVQSIPRKSRLSYGIIGTSMSCNGENKDRALVEQMLFLPPHYAPHVKLELRYLFLPEQLQRNRGTLLNRAGSLMGNHCQGSPRRFCSP